jgi:hypothetical protein
MIIMKKIIFILSLFLSVTAFAQVTTSKIQGVVSEGDAPLFGASVVAKHNPTGTVSGTMTQENGNYSITNLRVGGPYTVTISYVGFKTVEYSDIYLELGKTTDLNAVLASESEELEEVVIQISRDNTFNTGRTGSETSIGSRELTSLPTISRSQADFTRLEPSASGGSFGGRNDQYNNFSLNGTIFNNPFGLDAATPGGQTDAQPISLDAIDQIQVSTAPYDVSQSGFTGAAVNAVTKSGTNEWDGTVYGYFRNDAMTGNKIDGDEIFVPSLSHYQAGFSLGGPIKKDKIFFFINAERENRSDAGSDWVPQNADNVGNSNTASVLESDMIAVQQALANLGYDTGAYTGYKHITESWKGIVKLDFNINDKNRLALIYNFLDASKEKPAHPTALGFRGPGPSVLQFENSGYQMNNKINSFLAELNSDLGTGVSNKLQVGYTHFDDFREPKSVAAPSITIQNGQGANYIIAGHEPFSIHNTLDQKVFQFNDNLSIVKDVHNINVGLSFEKFQFGNSFNLGFLGGAGVFFPSYGSVSDFLADAALGTSSNIYAQLQAATAIAEGADNAGEGVSGGWNYYKINVGQAAVFAQDEISFKDNFKMTFGFRFDKPLYFNSSELAQDFIDTQCCYDPTIPYTDPETGETYYFDSTQMPSSKSIFSPRLGFNWDVNRDKSLQVRGGTGIFTGRFPFVWIGNQNGAPNSWFYEVIDPDFEWPRVWKTSLGIDKKLNGNAVATFDISYADDQKSAHVQNWGLSTPTGELQGVDNRPIYTAADKGNSAYVLTNSDKGYAFNISGKLQKTFANGFYTSIAYNFMESKDVNSIEAEITGDAFTFNPVYGDVNYDRESYSKYGDKHRVVGLISKKFVYGKDKWYTSFATLFEYAQGARFSYTYGGDINNDGSNMNDLIYIPTSADLASMSFNPAFGNPNSQRAALENFIRQDEYLNDNRGEFMERYGAIAPWRGRWDVKLVQGYKVGDDNSVEFSLDFLNFGNLLNSHWGLVQQPSALQPIGVTVDSTGNPTYSFSPNQVETFSNDASLISRWQVMGGLRYNF